MYRLTISLLLLLFAMPASGIQKCKGNTYAAVGSTAKQSCQDCSRCGAGYGYNDSYKRQENKRFGFLDCFPCTPCPEGKYRENESVLDTCIYCPSSCSSINRYDHIPCRENTRGSCGSCFSGYEPETLEPNSICVKSRKTLVDVESQATSTVPPVTVESNATPDIIMIVGISIAVALFLILIAVVLMKKGFPNLCSEYGVRDMKHDTYVSVERQSLETGTPFSSTDEIEVDGQGKPEMNSRHNILTHEQYLKSEIEEDITGEQNHRTLARRLYPDIPLYINNPLVCNVSRKITGKNRFDLFKSLGLQKCDWEPDNELWESGSQSYPEYIFAVLKKWIGIEGKNATIAKLFSALEEAQFNNVVEDLLKSQDFKKIVNNPAHG